MNLAALLTSVEAGTTVITATRRLARQVRVLHDKTQAARGRQAWRPVDAIPWDSWLERSWRRLRDWGHRSAAGTLLNQDQVRLGWEQSIARLENAGELLLPSQVAREAEEACALLRTYGLDTESISRQAGADTRQFLRAASWFQERCRDHHWLTRSDLPALLIGAAADVAAGNPRLMLLGFDALPPLHATLVDALSASGCRIERPEPELGPVHAHRVGLPDPESELRAMAATAADWLTGAPAARIGLVLVDMEHRRVLASDIFDDVLTPGRILPGPSDHERPFDMSLGESLNRWPIVDCALLALRLWLEPGPSTDVGRLLRSSFVGGATAEVAGRACLDAWLRGQGLHELGLRDLVTILEHGREQTRPDCPLLAQRLRAGLDALQDPGARRGLSAWAVSVTRFLTELGWPGDQPLESAEYQSVDKWREILERLASLEVLAGDVSGRTFLQRLSRLAADTVFQPESTGAPIQVLGVQETAGLEFDALWVGGLHHEAWPRPLRPNALLPAGLQRRCAMPRASAASELEFARRLTQRFAGAAPRVVFSWPRQEGDEVLRPSSLIADYPAVSMEPPPDSVWAHRQLQGAALETLDDFRLPRWPAGKRVRGGTGVLKAQSACPFQAQARYRLGATPLETPVPGVTPAQRGEIAHRALHRLWARWRSQAALVALDPADRDAQIAAALMRAARATVARLTHLDERVIGLECDRLSARVRKLLEIDASRAPFVAETLEDEHERDLTLADLRLRMRPDRVDRLADDGLVFLDYKTGNAVPSDWLGVRPKEPQLPIYALASEGAAAGIAFGTLAAGAVGYQGIARTAIEATGITEPSANRAALQAGLESWDKLLLAWRERLTALAREFSQGTAAVRPRKVTQDCAYCHLAVLCRRHELAAQGVPIDA